MNKVDMNSQKGFNMADSFKALDYLGYIVKEPIQASDNKKYLDVRVIKNKHRRAKNKPIYRTKTSWSYRPVIILDSLGSSFEPGISPEIEARLMEDVLFRSKFGQLRRIESKIDRYIENIPRAYKHRKMKMWRRKWLKTCSEYVRCVKDISEYSNSLWIPKDTGLGDL